MPRYEDIIASPDFQALQPQEKQNVVGAYFRDNVVGHPEFKRLKFPEQEKVRSALYRDAGLDTPALTREDMPPGFDPSLGEGEGLFNAFARGFYGIVPAVGHTSDYLFGTDIGPQLDYATRMAFPVRPDAGLAEDVAGGFGSVASFLLPTGWAGAAARGMGAGARGVAAAVGSTAAGLGAVVGGGQAIGEARELGATPEQELAVFLANAGIGLTEGIPLVNLVKRLDKYTGGMGSKLALNKFKSFGANVTKETIGQISDELMQEGAALLVNNASFKATGLDPERALLEDFPETALVTALTAGPLGAAGPILGRMAGEPAIAPQQKEKLPFRFEYTAPDGTKKVAKDFKPEFLAEHKAKIVQEFRDSFGEQLGPQQMETAIAIEHAKASAWAQQYDAPEDAYWLRYGEVRKGRARVTEDGRVLSEPLGQAEGAVEGEPESGSPRPIVYHGSHADFDEIKLNKDGMAWFSESERYSKEVSSDFDKESKVKPYELSVNRPLEISDATSSYTLDEWRAIFEEAGLDTSNINFDSALDENTNYKFFELFPHANNYLNKDSNLRDEIVRQGYDSVHAPSEHPDTDERNWVIFDAKQAKLDKGELAQARKKGPAVKASVRFTQDNQAIITATKKADITSFLHEVGHVFHENLSPEDQKVANIFVGQKADAKRQDWTVEQKEKFARAYERFFAEGKAPTPRLKKIFRYLKNWIAEIYKSIKGSSIDVEISPEMRQVFENHITPGPDFNLDRIAADSRVRTLRAIGPLSLVENILSVRAPFRRIGAPQTGEEITRAAGRIEAEESRVLSAMRRVRDHLKAFNPTKEQIDRIPFLLEDKEAIANMTPEEKALYDPLIKEWEEYRDYAFNRIKGLGGIENTFEAGIISRLQDRRARAQSKGASEKQLKAIDEEIELARNTNYVPFPVRVWMQNLAETGRWKDLDKLHDEINRRLHKVKSNLQVARRRDTIRLADVVKPGEISFADFMTSYARRVGKDIALLEIVNAAKREGLAVQGKVAPPSYKSGKTLSDALDGFYLHPLFSDYLDDLNRYEGQNVLQRGMAVAKTLQFYNPAVMNVINTMQMAMQGSLIDVKAPTYAWKALRSMLQKDHHYYNMYDLGGFSVPYSNPIGNIIRQSNKILRDSEGRIKSFLERTFEEMKRHPVRGTVDLATAPIQGFYNMVWDFTWAIDRFMRMMGYHYRLDRGDTPEQAAHNSAMFFGDYAGVPPKTRRALNNIFFTPTFKITMGKLYGQMFIQSMKKIGGLPVSPHMNNYARAAVILAVLQTSKDVLMQSFGFDTEEWGLRYKKKVDTPEGPRDLVVTMSDPTNMFQKYITRFERAFFDPRVENGLLQFVRSNRWELHPTHRLIADLVGNKNSMTNQPIYGSFDTAGEKALKTLTYAAGQILPPVSQALDAGRDYGREPALSDPDMSFNIIKEEMGALHAYLSQLFAFSYLRGTGEQRMQSILARLDRDFNAQVAREQRNTPQDAEGRAALSAKIQSMAAERIAKTQEILTEFNRENERSQWNRFIAGELEDFYNFTGIKEEGAAPTAAPIPARTPALAR